MIAGSQAQNRDAILRTLALFSGPLNREQLRTLADVTAEVGLIEVTTWRAVFGAPCVLGDA